MSYSMASLIKKTIHGKTYYYARECRRVDGRPKIVWQKYLGRADDLVAALTQPTATRATPPEKAVIAEFGAAVALYDLAQRLRLVDHIDRHVAARRGPHGPSVGNYLLIAALNRCLDPRSKVQIAAWYERRFPRRGNRLTFGPVQDWFSRDLLHVVSVGLAGEGIAGPIAKSQRGTGLGCGLPRFGGPSHRATLRLDISSFLAS